MRRALVAILLLAAVPAAGCTAISPSPRPSGGPVRPSQPPSAPQGPAPSPSACVEGYGGPPLNGASLERSRPTTATIFLALTWIEPRPSGSDWTVEPLPTTVTPVDPGSVTTYLGGPNTFALATDAETGWTPTVTRVWIGVGPDTAHLTDTAARATADGIQAIFPDTHGTAVLEAVIDFTDGCLSFEARALQEIRLVEARVAAACPVTLDGLQDLIARAGAMVAEPGDLPVRFVASEGVGVFGPVFWSADGPVLSAWDSHALAIVVGAGSNLTIKPGAPDLQLQGIVGSFYQRADMAAGAAGAEVAAVAQRKPMQAADGSLTVRVPSTPGRFVLLLQASYQLPCVVGSGFVVTSVDVP